MVKKRIKKNYYKNSRAKERVLFLRRCFFWAKMAAGFTMLCAVSFVFLLAHDLLVHSAYFEAKQITVDGNTRLTKQTILTEGDIAVGDNILNINLKVLQNRLLANPWIASVDVRRDLPDAIHIQIRENVPIAVVELDRSYLLNESGHVFKALESSEEIRVPSIAGLEPCDVSLNNTRPSRPLGAVLELLNLIRHNGSILSTEMVQRIHVDKEMGLTLYGPEDAIAIKIGYEDYVAKFNRLKEMMAYLKSGNRLLHVGLMDLNDMDRVIVRPVKEETLLEVCYRKEM